MRLRSSRTRFFASWVLFAEGFVFGYWLEWYWALAWFLLWAAAALGWHRIRSHR